jgi:Zn-dependent protease
MLPTQQGAFRLFRFAGINVFVHWTWFLAAVLLIQLRADRYSSLVWNGLEYLALFGIVTLHEFGHALACRSVGGRATQIVLWPLGGVAYVEPPPRPGAQLWSIVAGPLVNVVLVPVLYLLILQTHQGPGNLAEFVRAIFFTNLVLLIFNLLPVYPLDGGQILRSLLWFFIGPLQSLKVTAILGFIGVAGFLALAIAIRSFWFGLMTAFIAVRCWRGYQLAQALLRISNAPRREGYACPVCRAAPPLGNFWGCGHCRYEFDTFATAAICPQCQTQFTVTRCVDCGSSTPIMDWQAPAP